MDDEQEIDLDQITDENLLQSLLDQTDDPEDRKVIRDRIKELKATKQAKKNAEQEKLTKLTNTREDMLQKKKQEAEQHKQRTMAMYDNMAKSAPAGGQKKQDVSILKTESTTTTKTTTTTNVNPPLKLTNLPAPLGPRSDHVEDSIKKRQREAEDRKKRILAAFDVAAKSAPAGAPKDVDLDVANTIDIAQYEQTKKVEGSSTFQMSGGVPIFKRTVSVPSSPQPRGEPKYDELDAMEKALRERQRECAERKRQTLEHYNTVSKGQAGPKVFV